MSDKKLIIAGGRDFEDADLMAVELDRWIQRHGRPLIAISGMARGADTLGWVAAERRGIPRSAYPADWEKHGRAAGPIRNRQMAREGTHLLAFWDGKSPGTQHMIEVAEQRGLDVRVVRYEA